MRCPNCDSVEVHRSQRRDLYEGLVLRMMFCAPYHCSNCGLRFRAFSLRHDSRHKKRHSGLASYLGLHGIKREEFNRLILASFVALLIFLLMIWVILYLSIPSSPEQPSEPYELRLRRSPSFATPRHLRGDRLANGVLCSIPLFELRSPVQSVCT